jgi:2-polyprenyl-6-methoxyphenol hydroxylase-like FAD-dependent oxidoreductase
LQERARSVGVDAVYHRAVTSLDELGEADLIVGADGINSLIRSAFAAQFGTTIDHLSNRFAWFGTTKRFETLTQTFRTMPLGHFNAHHYRYSPDMSTFIVETDAATFANVGFGRMDEARSRAICEEVFRRAGRSSARDQPLDLAPVPQDLERALVASQLRADRRRAADGAFLDRLRNAACDGGCDRA